MPVLGDAGVVSSILNCILKLTSATPNADICSRCVLRAAELDPRGHKRAVDAHRLLCLAGEKRNRFGSVFEFKSTVFGRFETATHPRYAPQKLDSRVALLEKVH